MRFGPTIALARTLLADGRTSDVNRLVAPLLEKSAAAATGSADDRTGDVLVRTIAAQSALLSSGDTMRVFHLLGEYRDPAERRNLSAPARNQVELWLGWALAWPHEKMDLPQALFLLNSSELLAETSADASGSIWATIGKTFVFSLMEDAAALEANLERCRNINRAIEDRQADIWIDDLSIHQLIRGDRLREAEQLTRSMTRKAVRIRDDHALARSRAHLSQIFLRRGRRRQEILPVALEAQGLLESSGIQSPGAITAATESLVRALLRSGAWNEADRTLADTIPALAKVPGAVSHLKLLQAELELLRGDVPRARALLDEADASLFERPWYARPAQSSTAFIHGRTLVAEDDPAAAVEVLTKGFQRYSHSGDPVDAFRIACLLVECYLQREDFANAEGWVSQAVMYENALECPDRTAHRCHLEARLELGVDNYTAAELKLNQSLSLFESTGNLYSQGLAHLDHALLMWIGNTRGDARDEALKALDIFGRVGAVRDEEGTRRLILQIENTSRPPPVTGSRSVPPSPAPDRPVPPETDSSSNTGVRYVQSPAAVRGISSRAFKLQAAVSKLVHSGYPVIITGAEGNDQQDIARYIHECSTAGDAPFVHVNCRLEDERTLAHQLFGRTDSPGGQKGESGAFADAAGGTLYLEEIAALPRHVQFELLAHLEAGGTRSHRSDFFPSPVRTIASSSSDLMKLVGAGTFSERLFCFLNVHTLTVPELRDRVIDIPILVDHFVRVLRPPGSPVPIVLPEAMEVFLNCSWPGNVRQLRNEIERIMLDISREPLPIITPEIVSIRAEENPKSAAGNGLPVAGDVISQLDGSTDLEEVLARTERHLILQVLHDNEGQISATAARLGLSRQGLYKKMKRLGIEQGQEQFFRERAEG